MYTYIRAFVLILLLFVGCIGSVSAETIEYKTLPITTDGEIFVMDEQDDILFIGGQFSQVQVADGPVENRYNIAAISVPQQTVLLWNPTITIIPRSIEFAEDSIIIKDYLESDENTGENRSQVIINSTSGQISEPTVTPTLTPTVTPTTIPVGSNPDSSGGDVEGLMVDRAELGFQIPTLADILTFAVRAFFVIAGLAALFFLLMGAFTWITSGGDKDSVQSAKDKMQAAIVGVLMMVGVLAIVWTLEQVVMGGNLCFGISCPVSVPRLLQPT